MTGEETKKILATIKFAYDRFEVTKEKAMFWHDILKEYDFEAVLRNLKKYAATNKFAPAIADLTEGLYQDHSRPYNNPEQLSDEEIRKKWGLE